MTYAVSVEAQPIGQTCLVTAGTGTATNSDVMNVAVICDSGIRCGTSLCNPASDGCCDPEGTATCKEATQCTQLFLPCENSYDCTLAGQPGTVCCLDMVGASTNVSCAPSCSGGNHAIMCDPHGPRTCAAGTSCEPLTALAGYYACQ